MADSYNAAVGGYAVGLGGIAGTGITSAQRTALNAIADKFLLLVPDPATAVAEGKSANPLQIPDFALMTPEMGRRIRAEVAAMKVAWNTP